MITFQRDRAQVFGKDIPKLEKWQEAGRGFTPQRSRETSFNCKYSKVNDLRKGRSGT